MNRKNAPRKKKENGIERMHRRIGRKKEKGNKKN